MLVLVRAIFTASAFLTAFSGHRAEGGDAKAKVELIKSFTEDASGGIQRGGPSCFKYIPEHDRVYFSVSAPKFPAYRYPLSSSGESEDEVYPYVSDGTEKGTRRLGDGRIFLSRRVGEKNLFQSPHFTYLNEWVYFTCLVISDSSNSQISGLCRTDGHKKTELVKGGISFVNKNGSGREAYITKFREGLIFRAYSPEEGGEIWTSDGSSNGTRILKDINPGPADSDPGDFASIQDGDLLQFLAKDEEHGYEPWVTDGTPEGTIMLADTNPGPNGAVYWIGDWQTFSGEVSHKGARLMMVASEILGAFGNRRFYELWRTDGTREGTTRIKPTAGGVDAVCTTASVSPCKITMTLETLVDGQIFFFVNWSWDLFNKQKPYYHNSVELWKSDGSTSGTSAVKRGYPYQNSHGFLSVIGERLFFFIDDKDHGLELWSTDGSENGTRMVCDINPGHFGSVPNYIWDRDSFLSHNRPSVFPISVAKEGCAPWESGCYSSHNDSLAAEVYLVDEMGDVNLVHKFVPTPDNQMNIGEFSHIGNNTFLFRGHDKINGYGLWKLSVMMPNKTLTTCEEHKEEDAEEEK